MNKVLYLPAEDEPSVFTSQVGAVNHAWKHFAADVMVSLKNIPAIEFDIDKMPHVSFLLATAGISLQSRIARELAGNYPADLFTVPESSYTSKGEVSFRWVLHVCREDGMTPCEAYAYAKSLKN